MEEQKEVSIIVNESNQTLNDQTFKYEHEFSISVQKKRKNLLTYINDKRPFEVIITPHKKCFKGENVNNFRGSKYRGISKNGNSW